MTPFERDLVETIVLNGPMSVESYMARCLSYYYGSRDPLGASGDFTTSPEISQMFGELIGLWAAETWRLMGEPVQVHWVELGPGRGTLSSDAMRAARLLPPFVKALDVHLVETSPVLRESQKQALAGSGLTVTWHDDIGSLPDGPLLIVANEFFDALPVRQFQADGGLWRERCVGLNEDGKTLRFGLFPTEGVSLSLPPDDGKMLEVPVSGVSLMKELATRITRQRGAALLIDYGYRGPAYGDTLQALRQHQYTGMLDTPGEADITAHVDFQYLASAAGDTGACIHGLQTQGAFLAALGIETRASMLANAAPQEAASIAAALKRLAGNDTGDMGDLFKVMAVSSRELRELPGLSACATPILHSP